MKKVYGKLVRDRIIQIILKNGGSPTFRLLNEEEYNAMLKQKIVEEANELANAQTRDEIIEELCDLEEVKLAIANAYDINLEEIEGRRKLKKQRKGSFDNRVYLETVEEKEI